MSSGLSVTSPPVTPAKNNANTARSMSVWVRSSSGSNSIISGANSFTNTLTKFRKQSSKDGLCNDKNSVRKSKENSDSNACWYIGDNGTNGNNSEADSAKSKISGSTFSLSQQPVIELSQPLTSSRPLRSEVEKRASRPMSGHFLKPAGSPNRSTQTSSVSLSDNGMDLDTSFIEQYTIDDPPPIPAKSNSDYLTGSTPALDQTLNGESRPFIRARKVSISKMTRKPLPPLPSDDSPEPRRRHSADVETLKTSPIEKMKPEIPKKPIRPPPSVPIDYANIGFIKTDADDITPPDVFSDESREQIIDN